MSENQSVETLVDPPGAEIKVGTLDEIKARIQARRGAVKVETLPKHFHEALGAVHIALMPDEGYDEIEAAAADLPEFEKWPALGVTRFKNRARSKAYLKWGVYTADGKRLDEETLELLLSGDFGAENKKLVNAIANANPPRETFTQQYRILLGFNQMTVILLRILAKAGVLQQARDYLLAEPGSDESKRLAEDLKKWEATLPVWEAFLEAEATAKHFDLEVYKAEAETITTRE